jgi:HK97 family phage major capsid protein
MADNLKKVETLPDDEKFEFTGKEIRTLLAEQGEAVKNEVEAATRTIVEEAMRKQAGTVIPGAVTEVPAGAEGTRAVPMKITLPPNVVRYGSVRNFKGEDADLKAYRFGMWNIAAAVGADFAKRYCEENGLEIRAHQEKANEKGGFLVPTEFGNDLIDLREAYGVFRRNTRVMPMASDSRTDPRRTGGLSAYWEGESDAGTESTKNWDRVGLTAKKKMVLAKYSTELNEDAVISIGDDLSGEIAYAFELANDQAGFIGDGTSTYGKIVGVTEALKNKYGTGGGVGLVLGSGNAYSELVLADFSSVVAALPDFADARGNAKWYCSRSFFFNVMQKLALAAGGTTAGDIINGIRTRQFMGYAVETTQVMPKAAANSQVPCFFGDLWLASRLGDRRMMTIRFSEHALQAFENDEIVIRGTERLDINVHDVGNATDAGPVVGLIMAAS